MKKKQNRHSLHLIRQNVPQFILLVIFSVLLGISVIAVSVLMKMFLDIATNASAMPLTTCLIIAVGVLLVLGISQVVTSVLQGKLSCRMELSLRSAMVEHLYRTDLRTFDSGAADNYFTRMTKDAETLSNFYSKTLIPSIFFESFTFVVSFILMFLLEWKLAVVMIVVVPILIFTMIRISPKLEMNSIQIMQNEDKNRNILQEFLSQYMLFKSYGVLGWVQKRVGDTYAQKQKYVGKLSVLQGAIGFLNNFLGVGMFIIALGMGSFLVVRGETTVGTLIAVVNLVSFFYGPFLHISGWMAEVNEVKVSTNRIGRSSPCPPKIAHKPQSPLSKMQVMQRSPPKTSPLRMTKKKSSCPTPKRRCTRARSLRLPAKTAAAKARSQSCSSAFIRPQAAKSSSKSAIKPSTARKFAII